MAAAGTLGPVHRLQLIWHRTGGDDVGVTTHDFRQLDTVFPDAGTGGLLHNYATMEGDLAAWWTAVKPQFAAGTYPQEYRWYRNDVPKPEWGEPARVQTITPVAGTGAGLTMPGQVACSVTERVDSRRHWGRFYLPGPQTGAMASGTGRYTSTFVTALADATQTLYNAWNTRGLRCVVLGSLKTSATLALLPGTSWLGNEFAKSVGKGVTEQRFLIGYDVRQIRVDDVPDVIRSRRLGTYQVRLDRAIT